MPGLHAILSASAAKRWLSCPPSARLEQKLKSRFGEQSSTFAAEGTKAHALSELKLRKELGELNDFTFQENRKALGPIDNEMEFMTDIYVDTVMEKFYAAWQNCPDAILQIEERLDFSPWVPEGYGTGDAVIVSDFGLEVIDLKYGKGVPVDAVENPQARLYGLGAHHTYGDLYGYAHVRNTIVQPRLDSITEETLTRQELLDWGESIKPTAQLAWKGLGDYHAGDHCQFCAARALCYHRATQAMKIFDTGFDAPGILPDSEIPRILQYAAVAENWIKDIQEYALQQAVKGRDWPGYKLVEGRKPNRRWADEAKVAAQLVKAGYTEDQLYQKKFLTIGDAEKLLGRPGFKALLEGLTVRGSGAPTLVPESDKRPAFNDPDKVFSDLV